MVVHGEPWLLTHGDSWWHLGWGMVALDAWRYMESHLVYGGTWWHPLGPHDLILVVPRIPSLGSHPNDPIPWIPP